MSETIITQQGPPFVEIVSPGPQGIPGPGFPTSGTTGQVLAKESDANFDANWTSDLRADSLTFNASEIIEGVASRQLAWSEAEGTLELGRESASSYVGQEIAVVCRNSSDDSAIPKGAAVMITGSEEGRLTVAPMIADGTVPEYLFFGIASQEIAESENGYISVFGRIAGIDTSEYSDGDILWCDPSNPGELTNTQPGLPNFNLAAAIVIRADESGIILVRLSPPEKQEEEEEEPLRMVRGQASKMDAGTITIADAGAYVSTGLTATFDAATAFGVTLGTVDAFGLKNTSGDTKLLRFFGSIDAVPGNNETVGIKLALNGVAIPETECRAFKAAGASVAKLVTSWMIELDDGDEVSLLIANHSATSNIGFQRGRIIASEVF
jgi:hypothetical protein